MVDTIHIKVIDEIVFVSDVVSYFSKLSDNKIDHLFLAQTHRDPVLWCSLVLTCMLH
jgi:hypothetical protein